MAQAELGPEGDSWALGKWLPHLFHEANPMCLRGRREGHTR